MTQTAYTPCAPKSQKILAETLLQFAQVYARKLVKFKMVYIMMAILTPATLLTNVQT